MFYPVLRRGDVGCRRTILVRSIVPESTLGCWQRLLRAAASIFYRLIEPAVLFGDVLMGRVLTSIDSSDDHAKRIGQQDMGV